MTTKGFGSRFLTLIGKPLRLLMVLTMVFSTLSFNMQPVSAEGDVEAPAAPMGLMASGGDQQIVLTWDANTEADLAGYNLYRSEASPVEAGGSPLNGSDLITAETYTDTGLTNDTIYYYVLTAVDTSANESLASVEASATPAGAEPTEEPTVEPTEEPTEEPTVEPTSEPVEAPVCYALTISHEGNGSNPAADPANSAGCGAGEYVAGEAIQLSGALPDPGWKISGWNGTSVDVSKEDNNSLYMPASAQAAAVIYTEVVKKSEPITALGAEAGTDAIAAWTAYNDTVIGGSQPTPPANTTTYTTSGSTSGLLKNFATGANTSVTVTMSSTGSPIIQPDLTSGGTETAVGTDAYNTFHGFADVPGVIYYGSSSGWTVVTTFTGLDPAKTYTFATTANRAGTSSYNGRISLFTLSDDAGATNASTLGVTVVNDHSVSFITGENTAAGYVARWTGIQPGPDGDFIVTATFATAEYRAYGPSVFLLSEEVSTTEPTIATTGTLSVFSSTPGVPSTQQSYTVGGINLTENLVITAPADFQISTSSGSGFGSTVTLTPTSGTVPTTTIYARFLRATEGSSSGNITHISSGATTQNVAVSGTAAVAPECTTVNLVVSEDTYMSSYNQSFNYGSVNLFKATVNDGGTNHGSLLKWDLSSIPAGMEITDASLTLYASQASTGTYNLYNMRRSWVEGTTTPGAASTTSATWLTYDGTTSWGTAGAANTATDRYNINLWGAGSSTFSTTGSKTVDLNSNGIAVIQNWLDNPSTNYGLTIQNYSTTNDGAGLQVSSSENATTANWPKLNITYCVATTDPTITTTGTLSAFSSTPGVASTVKSYTVSGINLTANLVITAPSDFQISTSSGSGFGSTVTLTPASGTVPSTIIYARFLRATEGTSSGNITHVSSGATSKNVAVSGTATEVINVGWVAYNDINPHTGDLNAANVTEHTYATTAGVLKNYNTGAALPVTVTGACLDGSGTPITCDDVHSTNGGQVNSGTDAGNTFGYTGAVIVDMQNTVELDLATYDDLITLNNLDPTKTYTITLTDNRDNVLYDNARFTRVTIQGADTYTNASSSGVVVNSADSVSFSSGYNTTHGYVAKWTNITSGSDGSFSIKSEWDNSQGSGTSNDKGYGITAFKLEEGAAATEDPTITTSGTLAPFSSAPGVASSVKSYTVAAINLTANLVITAPTDFQISTSSGSGFGSTVTLTPASGTVPSTTIYARFLRYTAGTSSGNVTHVSSGATTRNIAVIGTAAFAAPWTAYNDLVIGGDQPTPPANTTTYTISGTTSGLLKNFATGENTSVTATISQTGDPVLQPSNATGGTETAVGTDAYTTFHGFADVPGVVYYGPADGWTVAITLTGLDPAKTYTFATTANRTGGDTYLDRFSRYTLSGDNGATNASTSGVTVINEHSVAFLTGENTTTGYVARWTGIQPGADGQIVITATNHNPSQNKAYGPSVFLLSEEGTSGYTLTAGNDGHGKVDLLPPGGTYAEDTIVTLTAVPNAGYTFSNWSGTDWTDLISNGNGTYSITMNEDKVVSANFIVGNTAPDAPVLVKPAENATGVMAPPTLEVTVTDPDMNEMDVDYYGRAVGGGGSGEDFTMILLPDTQNYSTSYPAIFNSQTDWIVAQESTRNIVFVTHTGDLVNTSSSIAEYINADTAMDKLDGPGIPYSVAPGNHDQPTTNYNTYFGVSRFAGKPWYGGSYNGTNDNNYSLFSASGNDFILINLQNSPTTAMLDWADALLKANPTRRGIVEQHDILNPDNSWYNQASYTALKDNPNLFLMLCGHNHTPTDGSAYRAELGDDSHTIHIMMADFQEFANGGNGFLRILRFSPVDDKIYATTYSPYTGTSITSTANFDQFEMAYDLDSGPAGSFALIGTDNDVSSGANASITWPGLSTSKEYEWYVTVSDGTENVTGSDWSFTTSASVNHGPVITEGTTANVGMSINGSPTAFALTLHATDEDVSDTLTWSISSAASHGTATATGSGTSKVIGYTPTSGYEGSDSFVVRVSDGSLTDTITVNVTIGGVNYAPDITEDWGVPVTMSINGTPVAFALTLHATDPNADTLTWSISSAASHGTATASGTGLSKAIGYTPTTGYVGSDTFIVMVSDGSLSDSIRVNVTIGEAPDITEDWNTTVTMSEDGSPTPFALTLHATDPDSPTLTWSISSAALHGTASTSGTGTSKAIEYSPVANYNGTDTFIVQVSDGVLSDTIKINVTIEAVNDAPVITESDPQPVVMSVNGTPTAFALTLHATDAEANVITWSILTAATHGTATASGTGTSKVIGYIPTTGYVGNDSFVVRTSDGNGGTDTITVNVAIGVVNIAPVITESDPQAVGMSEDGSPSAFSKTLHATDADVSDTITWSISSAASHGTATASGTGVSKAIGYSPAANYNGSDSFTVMVSDGNGGTDTITINVTIAAVNDAPVVTDIPNQTIAEGASFTTISLDAYVSDVDNTDAEMIWTYSGNTQLTVSIVSRVATITKPNADWNGAESVTFTATDPGALFNSNAATFTVTAVNDAPVVTDIPNQTIAEGSSFTTISLDAYVSDVDNTDAEMVWTYSGQSALTVSIVSRVATITKPNADWNGAETVTFTATDPGALFSSNAATFTVTAVNDAPVITESDPQAVAMSKNGSPTAFALTLHATDVEANVITWSILTAASHGTATASGTGLSKAIGYTPNTDYVGSDTFVVQVSDGNGGTDTITVNVTIGGANTLPVCSGTTLGTDEDTQGQALPVCTDGESDPLTYSIVAQPGHGTASVVSGNLVYMPSANYNGGDSFTYRANDGTGNSNTATVTVTVNAVNDAPVCAGVALVTNKNTLGQTNPSCTDVDSITLTYSIVSQPGHGTASVVSGKLTYNPTTNYFGSDSFTYKASDGLLDSIAGSVTVTVNDIVVITRTPSIPSLVSPALNALLFDLTPRLDWGTSSVPSGSVFDHYELQVATDSAFAALVSDQVIADRTTSEYTLLADLLVNTKYYWRVRAFNATGQYSNWSAVRYFREAMLPPALNMPVNGAMLNHLRPTFDWGDVAGASSYTIQVSRYSNMSSPSVNKTVAGSEYIPTSDLTKNRILYWRVRVNGANGPSAWSEIRVMTTPNTPTTPSLVSPALNALLFDLTPRLDWSNSSLPSGTFFDSYILQVSTDSGFSVLVIDEVIAGQTNSEYTVMADLLVNTKYYWRVGAINTDGEYSSWSTVRYFREAMLPPALNAPVNGAAPLMLRPLFDWSDVAGASSYTIQVSSYSSMSSPSVNKTVAGSEYEPTSDLAKNRTLYWRVRVNGANGPSVWSAIRTLVTPNTPTTPSLVSPANNVLLTDLTPRLDWSNSSVPSGVVFDRYQLQVATDSGFSAVVIDVDINDRLLSEYTPLTDLMPNTRYYWRVRAFNTAGQYSSWSAVRYFREAMLAPALVVPTNGAVLGILRPTFDWGDVAGASSYTIQVSRYSSMSSPSVNKTVASSEYLPTSDLAQNRTLYWRVRANGINGPSVWSVVRTLVIMVP